MLGSYEGNVYLWREYWGEEGTSEGGAITALAQSDGAVIWEVDVECFQVYLLESVVTCALPTRKSECEYD